MRVRLTDKSDHDGKPVSADNRVDDGCQNAAANWQPESAEQPSADEHPNEAKDSVVTVRCLLATSLCPS